MFRGVNPINLDAKGRMALPARYREAVHGHCEGRMVVTIDTEDQCLLLYPQPEWDEIQAKIDALPSFNRAVRRIQRLLTGHATDLELDANGRMLLPAPLREYAELDKEIQTLEKQNLPVSDENFTQLKASRAHLKDQLYNALLKASEA